MLLFRLRDHMRRMEISQRVLRFDTVISAEEMEAAVIELVRRNGFRESIHIRPTAYLGGDGEAGARGPPRARFSISPKICGRADVNRFPKSIPTN